MMMRTAQRNWITGVVAIVLAGVSAQEVAGQVRLTGPRKVEKADLSDRTVTFQTSDGVEIEADWYPAKVDEGEKSPVAILIHMYPATRSSWKPMVPILRNKLGISVLAYDIRGTGGSTKPAEMELEKKYKDRDTAHFAAAYQDAMAAYQWLSQQSNVDVSRLIVIGASVGCSISLEFASQGIEVKGVACLSPGTDYMGIDSISHIKALKGRGTKVLLISPEGEYDAVEALLKAADGDYAKGKKYPGGKENHGTRMFDAKYGKKVKLRLEKFARGVLDIEKKADKKSSDDD
ncbi:MAG: alpha/beta fold hydrolase [Phycisphaerales bacterium]|nr:alpha/beta fold hydrolase [Phycisphaerales bacterium]MCB9855993.1 alpha/beta fold hydrolase [Phycisphaerales bacterium]MCB9864980.1 alpha/beta fold hydrolase [Phycisphaerales bacterium]